VFAKEKDLQSFAVTENLYGRFEIGYAYERLGLGDWPDDVKAATQPTPLIVNDYLGLHNLNLRGMVVQEGDFNYPWMPAITFGTHFKWNESTSELNSAVSTNRVSCF